MKKILSLIMALALVISAFALTSFAMVEEGDEEDDFTPLAVLSTEYNSADTIYLQFTGKVDNVYDPQGQRGDAWAGWCTRCGFAIVESDTDFTVQLLGDTPMIWGGTMDYPLTWANGETMSCRIVDATLGCATFEDIFGLVKAGGAFEGKKVAWFIEEQGTQDGIAFDNGYVDPYFEQVDWSVEGATVTNYLAANWGVDDFGFDRYFVVLPDEFEAKTTKEKVTTEPEATTAGDTTAKSTEKVTEGTEKAGEDEESKLPLILGIVGGVVVLAAIVVVVIIISKKKK